MKKITVLVLGVLLLTVIIGATVTMVTTDHTLAGPEFVATYSKTPNSILLDVRTPSEFNSGHIKGAINIDFENPTFSETVQKLDPQKSYFVYCRSGNRSGKAITVMKEKGIPTIYELQGGIIANTVPLITTVEAQNAVADEYVVDPSDMLDTTPTAPTSKTTLSTKEVAGLVQMREEEKLARDVYTTLGNTWSLRTFSNITASEQTHTNAVKALLDTYAIPDPVTDDTVGKFKSPAMQNLYTSLVEQGQKSLRDALIVGATIEDLDIHDLNTLSKETSNSEILATYSNLERGSRNHMRAFVKNLAREGGTYTPAYISQEAFDAIITAQQERGR